MHRPDRSTLLSLSAALLLAACGGSGGGGAPGGSAGSFQLTRGAITAQSAGAITVNGVKLSTAGAAVRMERVERAESELARGMVVTVRGTFDDRTGTATEIEMEDALTGHVGSKGLDDLVVDGVRVHVDGATEFEHAGRLDDVRVGDRIRVSGVADDRGGLRASRIDSPDDASNDLEVKGSVSSLSAGGFTLTTAGGVLQVTLAAGVTLPAGLADGDLVEIHAAAAPVDGAVTATAVHREDRLDDEVRAAEIEVEGIVTSGDAAEFVVDGQTIRTDGSTRWEFGVPADLLPGVKVEAEGHGFAADGALLAEKVSFRAVVRIRAAAADVALAGESGSLSLLGLSVSLSSATDWRIDPAAVVDGAIVELRGYPAADGSIVGTRIEPESGERVFLTGPVTEADATAGTVKILGITVTSAGATFHDHAEAPLSRDAFFAAIEPGRTVVKARGADAGALSGTTLAAEELELEGDE